MHIAHFRKIGNIWSTSQSWQGAQAALAAKMPYVRTGISFGKYRARCKKSVNRRYDFQYMHFLKRIDAYKRIAAGTFKPKTLLRSPFRPSFLRRKFKVERSHSLTFLPWRTGFQRNTIRNILRFRSATFSYKFKVLQLYRWREQTTWRKCVVPRTVKRHKFYRQYPHIIGKNPLVGWFLRKGKIKSRRREHFTTLFPTYGKRRNRPTRTRFYVPVSHIININPAINNTFISLTGPHRNYLRLTNKINSKLRRCMRRKRYRLFSLGKTLTLRSAGMVGFYGPKRSTPFAAEETGRSLAKFIKSKKLKNDIWLISHTCRNKLTAAAIRGLLDTRYRIRPTNFFIRPAIPYSKGMRKPKLRRV